MKTLKKQSIIMLSLLISFVVLLTSCKSDENDNPPPEENNFSENWGAMVSRDFMGKIVDENNNPLSDVQVEIGNDMTTTDTNGVFIINGANVHEKFAYIKAKKSGYINMSRSMIPKAGVNYAEIKAMAEELVNLTIASGVDSEVTITDGTTVKFDGAFKDANGSAYSGNVSVYVSHLSSSDPDVNKKMPGMLYAQNSNNEERILETYGMINVELRGSGGEKLNIADGHKAVIELPIDASQSNAPNTIELWHFDEEKGYWIEDGSATKVGNKYVGEVSHFSWWNCDAQFPTVRLCLNVTNSSSTAMTNIKIEFSTSIISPRIGFTDGSGDVCGLIPSNTVLDVNAYDVCGSLIYTGTIGPFSSDTNTSLILSSSVQSSILSGNLVNCSNSNVTNGYIVFNYGSIQVITPVNNGAFSFSTAVCSGSNSFSIEGVDLDSLESSGVINQTFTLPSTNLGNIIVCGSTISEFISYQINGNPAEVFLNPSAYVSSTGISVFEEGNSGYIQINGNANVLGVYNSPDFDFSGIDRDYSVPTNIQFTLSNVGTSIGDYVDMTFIGTYTDNSAVIKNITGTVHVKRDN